MAQFNYVPDYNDQYTGFEPLPAGEYKVQIVDSDITVPNSGDGKMLVVVYEVIANPQFEGRKVRDYLCYVHSKPDTERTAVQKINTIFYLTGLKGTKDTAQLHGKTLSLILGVKDSDNEKYGPKNFIKKYLPFNPDREEETGEENPLTGLPSAKKPSFVK